jgi:hypothetical protein
MSILFSKVLKRSYYNEPGGPSLRKRCRISGITSTKNCMLERRRCYLRLNQTGLLRDPLTNTCTILCGFIGSYSCMCRSRLNNRDRTNRTSSESDNLPFLRKDCVDIKDELASLKVPDSKEAPLTYQFAKYLKTFCELYISNASPSEKFTIIYSYFGLTDAYKLLKDLLIKLSFLIIYTNELSALERDKFVRLHGYYLHFCQVIAPNPRLRGF